MIHLTSSATEEIKRLLAKQNKTDLGIRLGVRGGGCSGLSYQMSFGEKKEGDHEFKFEDVSVFVDPKSYLYLNEMTLDFVEDLKARGFKFVNPNAQKSCGCGESFSV
ncbi:MAG: iron-sulfur cluster assembly accessory protein [Candidatus Omnitrophica bacterium CG11_big_fil_rev_8_21_14_0_20_45_26]|uniref:Iron-sulfur cluster assembly accessory protein n=1 Tax=Candidatus Abzuiibacterium crystallinum TaxID=1974748 RepID=A0A2H0LR09_9BACT|nr:MAG: iron-sulfur cluster assembly accessory protein [Candidatus Omnitrophica bacterium CG11_big_fil_rev_8_21_14_0_20_45_26]PIW64247.1 MAG: iron-sulfur cluster assembly accessory protein [Candidatus Omnitrophica bacterium CG12_big_fil_rev_8_21_14_0_65_45_16]